MSGVADRPIRSADWAIRSWIYAGADDDVAVERAMASNADAVILDLEDLVSRTRKALAREAAVERIEQRAGSAWPRVYVRINNPVDGELEHDLDAVVRPGVAGIRFPKGEDPSQLAEVDGRLASLERSRGLPVGAIRVVTNIESAAGVLQVSALLRSSHRVDRVGFGEADFSRDVRARVGRDKDETFVARSMLVLASRAAGRLAPCDGAHLNLSDSSGLRQSTERGRDLGFFGRTTIHPDQVPVVNEVYTPSSVELASAREIIAAQAAIDAEGRGSAWLPDGRFVDIAVTRAAEDLIALDEAIRVAQGVET